MRNDELVVKKIIRTSKIINTALTLSENRALISFIEDFEKQRISHIDFRKSIQLLFEKQHQVDEDGNTQHLLLRRHAPKIYRTDESKRLAIMAKVVDKKSKEYPILHRDLKIRVTSDERESKHFTNAFNLEGKKRRIFHVEPFETPLKKPRKSMWLNQVTPSYKLIPEEEQSPAVSDPVLNNKYVLAKVDGAFRHKKLTRYEERMATCEDEMFERDIEIGALRSTVESAEKVINGEIKMEDLGVKFYRCMEKQYSRDISEIVRQDHKEVLPVILPMLKLKLNDLTVAMEELKPGWRKVFEENTAKQTEFAAQSHRRKLKKNNKKFESDFRQPSMYNTQV